MINGIPYSANPKSRLFNRHMLRKTCSVFLIVSLLIPTLSVSNRAYADPIPTSDVFDLHDSSDRLIREEAAHNATVIQAIGFDNVNQFIFTTQLIEKDLQLPGESAPVSAATRKANGDLCITKFDLDGNELSYMYVKGAGHGVSIGVEPGVGQNGQPVTYLWTETDSYDEGGGGRGTQIARFPFTDGAVVTPNTPFLEKHDIIPGAYNTTASIDMAHNHLILRYRLSGVYYFDVYDLDEVKLGNYVSLAHIQIPVLASSFQGYTAYGSYVYILEGSAYGTTGSVYPNGNTYITSIDLNTGVTHERWGTRAAYTLDFREPEGLAIQIPDMNNPDEARLAMGFASTVSSTNTSKLVSIYYKDEFE